MFREGDRVTQAEILRQLRMILRQLAEIRATVDTLSATQAHILSRLPRPDDEARERVDEIREDILTIRENMLQDLLDRMDDLLGQVRPGR